MFPIENKREYQLQGTNSRRRAGHGSVTFLTAATGPASGCFITALASLGPILGCVAFAFVVVVDVAVMGAATETAGNP